jgi:hypothetical protein
VDLFFPSAFCVLTPWSISFDVDHALTGACFEYGFNLDQGPTRLVSNSALHKLSKVKATREQGEFQLKKKKKKNEGNMNI